MTERKRWPVVAEQARVESLAHAQRGLRSVTGLLDVAHDVETVRRIAVAIDAFHRIIHQLGAVGPQADSFREDE